MSPKETSVFHFALANVTEYARGFGTALTLSYTGELPLLDIRHNGAGFARQTPADGCPPSPAGSAVTDRI